MFQHAAARRRLGYDFDIQICFNRQFQHAAARRRLAITPICKSRFSDVSTRSRPKAAGETRLTPKPNKICFNTQPPEGGWSGLKYSLTMEI